MTSTFASKPSATKSLNDHLYALVGVTVRAHYPHRDGSLKLVGSTHVGVFAPERYEPCLVFGAISTQFECVFGPNTGVFFHLPVAPLFRAVLLFQLTIFEPRSRYRNVQLTFSS
jgi:hypothetical protein